MRRGTSGLETFQFPKQANILFIICLILFGLDSFSSSTAVNSVLPLCR